MKSGVLRLQRPGVVTLHHDDEDMRRLWTAVAWSDSLETIVEIPCILGRAPKDCHGSAANIAIRQEYFKAGRPLHRVFLPDRVAQREERIEHDLVQKGVAG